MPHFGVVNNAFAPFGGNKNGHPRVPNDPLAAGGGNALGENPALNGNGITPDSILPSSTPGLVPEAFSNQLILFD